MIPFRSLLVLLVVITSFTICVPASLSADELDRMQAFAQELQDKGDYYRAITEYLRINSYFPDNPSYLDNVKSIAECYESGGLLIESIEYYRMMLKLDPENWTARYKEPSILQQSGDYERSEYLIEKIHANTTARRDSLRVLSFQNLIHMNRFEEARDRLTELEDSSLASRYLSDFDSNMPLHYKSATKAAILGAIVPGAGYAYTKRPQTAFAAFIVISLLGWAAWDSFDNGHNGAGYAFSIIGFSFYSGSVWGSIQVTDDYNAKILSDFAEKFK